MKAATAVADALAIAYLHACVRILEAGSRFAAWKARRRVRRQAGGCER